MEDNPCIASKLCISALLQIKDELRNHLIIEPQSSNIINPFDASIEGDAVARFENTVFEVLQYDVSKEMDAQTNKYNFKYNDLEFSWYYSLCSISNICWCNKKLHNDEIETMLEECVESLATRVTTCHVAHVINFSCCLG
jgi:hypothetical protein